MNVNYHNLIIAFMKNWIQRITIMIDIRDIDSVYSCLGGEYLCLLNT